MSLMTKTATGLAHWAIVHAANKSIPNQQRDLLQFVHAFVAHFAESHEWDTVPDTHTLAAIINSAQLNQCVVIRPVYKSLWRALRSN